MNKWLKIFLVILLFAGISVALYFILKALNIADIETIKQIVLNSKQYGIFVYLIITVLMLTMFCFMPLLNTALIVLGIFLFDAKTAFFVCVLSVILSNSILFFIGDKFGEKVASKLIGKEELDKAQNLIHTKSKILLPIFFLVPGLPDEALCLVAGMTKIKYWYLILISTIYHAIEIGAFCFFGSGLINWSSLTLFDWILTINLLLIDIYFLFKLEKFIENKDKNIKN